MEKDRATLKSSDSVALWFSDSRCLVALRFSDIKARNLSFTFIVCPTIINQNTIDF